MISIIIPVYNVEDYIRECLESIEKQSFSDYEVIIVDDESTDGSIHIADEFRDRINNLKIIMVNHGGVAAAKSEGYKLAKGEYILFVDPDDYLEIDMLENLYETITKYNGDIAICEFNSFFEDTKEVQPVKYDNEDVVSNIEEVMKMVANFKLQGQLWNKLIKKAVMEKSNFDFEKGRIIEDIYPFIKVVSVSDNILFVNKPLYNYRIRSGSLIGKVSIGLLDDYYYFMKKCFVYLLDKCPYLNDIDKNTFGANILTALLDIQLKLRCNDVDKNRIKYDLKIFDVGIKAVLTNKRVRKFKKIIYVLWKCHLLDFYVMFLKSKSRQ